MAALYSIESLLSEEIPLLFQLMPPGYFVLPSMLPDLVRSKPNEVA
jgi:hypothetical protein